MKEKNIKKLFRTKQYLITLFLAFSFSCIYRRYDGLMSREEYLDSSREGNYVVELNSAQGSLLYYGAFHRVDPNDPQFADIEEKWERFRPSFAYSEGCLWPLEKTREEAIRKYGEQGLLRFLAKRDGVPIRCLDPPLIRQAQYLSHYFLPEQIKIFFVLRQASISRILKKDPRDLRYVDSFLTGLSALDEFKGAPHNLDEFCRAVSHLFPQLEEWDKIPFSYFYEPAQGRFLAQIHSRLNEFRDHFMISVLLTELKKGNRIFAIVGRSHVVIQEPVLRSACG